MESEKGKEGAGVDRKASHQRTDDAHFAKMPSESAAGATGLHSYPAPLLQPLDSKLHISQHPLLQPPHSELHIHVPFVNRTFESEIQGTMNFTTFCCVLLVTWCHRVRFSSYLRPK